MRRGSFSQPLLKKISLIEKSAASLLDVGGKKLIRFIRRRLAENP
jgi:hypothetical protein